MSEGTPPDLPTYRLDSLERKVGSIESSVNEISGTMLQMRDSMESSSREATQYRRETRHDIKCITDTWAEFQRHYGPLLTELRDGREEKKKLRSQLALAWLVAASIGAGTFVIEWVRKHIGS